MCRRIEVELTYVVDQASVASEAGADEVSKRSSQQRRVIEPTFFISSTVYRRDEGANRNTHKHLLAHDEEGEVCDLLTVSVVEGVVLAG